MKDNEYFYLDEGVLADRGFHVPTHRIIKIPHYNGNRGTGRGYGIGLGIGLGISLSLHLLLLLSLKAPRVADMAHAHSTATEQTMQVEIVDQKSLEQLVREPLHLPYIVYPNPKAELGTETQYMDPNKSDNRPRLLERLILPNYLSEEKLRDVILAGKSPDELYTGAKILSEDDYNDFLLLYVTKYVELKRNRLLVTDKIIDDNKVDLVMYFRTQVDENGKINLLRYEQSPNLTRLESDILSDALTHLKRIPNFISPSKANLKAPRQLEFWYYVTYKTAGGVDFPVNSRSVAPIR